MKGIVVLAAGLAVLGTALIVGLRTASSAPFTPLRFPPPVAAAIPQPPKPAPRAAPVQVRPVPLTVRTLTPREFRERMGAGSVAAFVGSVESFERRHIPGATCVPYAQLKDFFSPYARTQSILLYCGCCGGESEGVSGAAVRTLQEMGFRDVAHLGGHLAAWEAEGLPLVGSQPIAATQEEKAWSTPDQRRELVSFEADARARRAEIEAAVQAERDPKRAAELRHELARLDAELEIEGYEIKRRIAVENGDTARADAFRKVIDEKRETVR